MTAPERITKLCEHFNLNVKVFSELCGYDRPQVFYDVLKGRTRNISTTMCDRILSAFPNVNRVWLLTGTDDMLLEPTASATVMETPNEPSVHTIPMLSTAALAGPLYGYFEGGEDLEACEQIATTFKNAEMAIPVNGDSMEPMFDHGSTLYIKRINEAAFIPWGNPLVIDTENGVFVKRVLPDSSDENYIWAESVNPKYPPMHIPKTSIHGMYRVVANIKHVSML